jgi:sec-independent protein translocase protein TatA
MLPSIILFLNMGGGEVLLVVFFILLFFGAKKIPELARGLGKGIREFKDAASGIQREIQQGAEEIKKETEVKE